MSLPERKKKRTLPICFSVCLFLSFIRCHHGTPSRIPLIRDSPNEQQQLAANEFDDGDNISHQSNSSQVPITLILVILISYISIGTVIFSLWENWSMVDGAYFCFVTLSTIGFGDLVPQKTFQGPDVQLFACCAYLLLGLVLVAMSFSLLETQLLWKCKRMAVRLKLAKDWLAINAATFMIWIWFV